MLRRRIVLSAKNAKLRVEVVYAFRHGPRAYLSEKARLSQLWGADAMRLQIRESMVPHLPKNIDLTFSGLCFDRLPVGGRSRFLRSLYFGSWLKTRRPAVFILLKHVALALSPGELEQLKEKAVSVGVDHKDADPLRLDLSQYDFHIAASETGRRAIVAMLAADGLPSGQAPFVSTWFQRHDQRLDDLRFQDTDRLAAVYLGEPCHAEIPPTISDLITSIPARYSRHIERAVSVLGQYNFHFGVRPSEAPVLRRIYKPFTKGITAAACRSNILINRQVDDATEFLGPDYPYLLDSNAPAHVEEGFRKAHEEFGGSEWHRGLEIMRSVRDRVSPSVQVRQFTDIVTRAADQGAQPPARIKKTHAPKSFLWRSVN